MRTNPSHANPRLGPLMYELLLQAEKAWPTACSSRRADVLAAGRAGFGERNRARRTGAGLAGTRRRAVGPQVRRSGDGHRSGERRCRACRRRAPNTKRRRRGEGARPTPGRGSAPGPSASAASPRRSRPKAKTPRQTPQPTSQRRNTGVPIRPGARPRCRSLRHATRRGTSPTTPCRRENDASAQPSSGPRLQTPTRPQKPPPR